MELVGAAGAYLYTPLRETRCFSTRLFALYPASGFSAPIQGELDVVEFANLEQRSCRPYEALSYAWEDTTPTGIIHFPDRSCLPIAANLESFLRHRRQCEETVVLWIDAICINQYDLEEKSSQVQVMGQIYAISSSLTIWLGPPADESKLAMSTLREISYSYAFSKLSTTREQSAAIDHLMSRAWWSRAWIIQEVAYGGCGTKYSRMTVRCGPESILWQQLVLACSRMYVNSLNMRQRFPAVENVLKLDVLPTRNGAEFFGVDEPLSSRLLKQLAKHRKCLATNPRDKIYALRSLWPDALDVHDQARAMPVVDYDRCTKDVYVDFGMWIINESQSLKLLHHCQMKHPEPSAVGILPTWVPDWSQAPAPARLPCLDAIQQEQIPWWSLPIRSGAKDNPHYGYNMDSQLARRKRAEEILRPIKSTLKYVPEWLADTLDPDGTKGVENWLKELQNRPDFIFIFPDESDRALGNDTEGVTTALERTKNYNEHHLQKQILSQYLKAHSLLQSPYRACAETTCAAGITEGSLSIEGILFDTVEEIFETFPEEIEEDWANSTLLMVQIGKCKRAVMNADVERTPYCTESTRLLAFWRTLFAGQQASDETMIGSWLPHIPHDWQRNVPSLTVLESARLEHAEIRVMTEAYTKHLTDTSDGGLYSSNGFDEDLADDDRLLDIHWTSQDRCEYRLMFEKLGKYWHQQPYDLYHRPFRLPFVVPDPYWDSRKSHDETALQASVRSRHRTIIESLNAEGRELRRTVRRFMRDKIQERPAREPPTTDDSRLIKYALGRNFFVSADGYFGIAPPSIRKGDCIAVLLGVDVPFILRKVGSAFQVVGESYVHGLMDGEAIDKWRLGQREIRKIVLV